MTVGSLVTRVTGEVYLSVFHTQYVYAFGKLVNQRKI